MKKSAKARLQMRKRGTSILVLLTMLTSSTVPLPSNANRKTIQTPQRSDHQPMRSSHGMNGPVGEKGEGQVEVRVLGSIPLRRVPQFVFFNVVSLCENHKSFVNNLMSNYLVLHRDIF